MDDDFNFPCISGDSPEAVALALLHEVSKTEDKHSMKKIGDDRKWLLDTYAECLQAVKGDREWEFAAS